MKHRKEMTIRQYRERLINLYRASAFPEMALMVPTPDKEGFKDVESLLKQMKNYRGY